MRRNLEMNYCDEIFTALKLHTQWNEYVIIQKIFYDSLQSDQPPATFDKFRSWKYRERDLM